MLAPIGMSVYARLDHVKQAINALRSNTIANKSRLHIFSDGPRHGDEAAVKAMRDYVSTIDGFDDVVIIERDNNSRIHNNRGGQKFLLDKFGKVIWMEEDIVTQRGFLEFMNNALDFYENDERIFSITGYAPPYELPGDYRSDVFFMRRFCAWGFGTWRNRYSKINPVINKEEYYEKITNRKFYNKLRSGGHDIPRMIDADVHGRIDALDVKIMYQQALCEWYTVYPRKSLVQNIGHDGSGLHCCATDRFNHDELWSKLSEFKFPEQIALDNRIVTANRRFRRLGFRGELAELKRRLRMYMH